MIFLLRSIFMQQLVFKNRIYILGQFTEVIKQLKELSCSYNTVKEVLDSRFNEFKS